MNFELEKIEEAEQYMIKLGSDLYILSYIIDIIDYNLIFLEESFEKESLRLRRNEFENKKF